MPRYGDKTQKELENYLIGYSMPTGKTRTGLAAPYHDLNRNFETMKRMKLMEGDKFFHCKANYEAASRGTYSGLAAYALDVVKEAKDIGYNRYPVSDSLRDFRANIRGQQGARAGKTLRETCPTHHTKYK